MDKSHQDIIRKIADDLNCGLDCYYHVKSQEVISVPNFSDYPDSDEFKETFKDELDKIKRQRSDLIKIEVPRSFESYKIMERFAEQINEDNFRIKLQMALNKKKPFQNFKRIIDSSEYRQNYFDFKQKELEKLVAKQLVDGGVDK